MKLNVSFAELQRNADRMGDHSSKFTIDLNASSFELDEALSSSVGIEVTVDELDFDTGLLAYESRQVILFIPEQRRSISEVLQDGSLGTKYHIADCRTLNEMRRKKRFDRYKVTNNTDGIFAVYGCDYPSKETIEGEAELSVCKNCLDFLAYKGFGLKKSAPEKQAIFGAFDLREFLVTYSTLFKSLPNRPVGIDQSGYSDDWPDISKRIREACGYQCDSCKVDLSHAPNLLHVHHVDGNKRHNQTSNLRPLCADCHRKQPNHHAMYITKSDMDIIQAARRTTGVFEDEGDWNLALDLADTAVHGLIHKYRAAGKACPQVGYEVQDEDHRVLGELELAWPKHKRGIAIDQTVVSHLVSHGWKVVTVGDALREINNR